MLEHVPGWLGGMMRNVRAGHAKLVIAHDDLGIGAATIDLTSPAFAAGARLPERFTADGAGISPPLLWGDVPAEARSLVLIVEDPDAPAPQPLVHAIMWGIPADERRLAEGAIAKDGAGGADGRDVGRNSYLAEGWLPPDPPTGHGPHDYVFQLFALAEAADAGESQGRSAIVKAMAGKVLAAGLMVGTYSRGDASAVGMDEAVRGAAPA